jgi:aspartate aminotransferase
VNYPSNPTGVTYTFERLKRLAEVARHYPEGTIISNGLSKWCGAGGWRLGFLSFPSGLRWLHNAMAMVASETYTSTSAPIQYAAVTAFNGGQFMDEYLNKSPEGPENDPEIHNGQVR